LNAWLTHDGGVAHLIWWIRIVGAHGVRPKRLQGLRSGWVCALDWHP